MKKKSPILFVDYCGIPDKYAFLARLAEALAPRRLIVVEGPRRARPEDLPDDLECLAPRRAPFHRRILRDTFVRARPFPGVVLDHFEDLTDQLTRIYRERRKNASRPRAAHDLVDAYDFTARVVAEHRPALALVWNQFHPLSMAAQSAVRNHDVPVAFIEYGLLPGTLNFDFLGQMGESAVARNAEAFAALPVEAEDLTRAEATLDLLRSSRANRRPQPGLGHTGTVLRKRAAGRPIVLFAGHNDHASGVVPWDEHARRYHSPLYESSMHAAQDLDRIARERGWFVLYKPHPFAARAQHLPEGDNLAVLGRVDISDCVDFADCVVTVLSQVSYVGLVRRKPLVMLGHNQLRHAACHYRVERVEETGDVIAEALARGFTSPQSSASVEHVARLLKYYLYRLEGFVPSLDTALPAEHMAERIEAGIARGAFVDF